MNPADIFMSVNCLTLRWCFQSIEFICCELLLGQGGSIQLSRKKAALCGFKCVTLSFYSIAQGSVKDSKTHLTH